MKRLLRTLLNAATAASLGLCLAALAFWVRSYFANDWFHYVTYPQGQQWTQYSLASNNGSLYVSYFNFRFNAVSDFKDYVRLRESPPGFSYQGYPPRPNEHLQIGSRLRRLGFYYQPEYDTPDARGSYSFPNAAAPHWFLALLAATLPASRLHLALRRRRRRKHTGHCPTWGYDLRATPNRCPECGTIPAA